MGLKELKKTLALESDILKNIKTIDAYFSNAKYLAKPKKFYSDLESVVDYFGTVDDYGNSTASNDDLELVGTVLVHAYVNSNFNGGDKVSNLIDRFEDWPVLYMSAKDPYNTMFNKRKMIELEAPEAIFGQLREFPANMSVADRAAVMWGIPDMVDAIFKTQGMYNDIYLDARPMFDNINRYIAKYKDSLDEATILRLSYLFSIHGNTYTVKDNYSSSINAPTVDLTLDILKYTDLKELVLSSLPDMKRFDLVLGMNGVIPLTFDMWCEGLKGGNLDIPGTDTISMEF